MSRSDHIAKAHFWPKARIGCAARHAAGELKSSLCVAMVASLARMAVDVQYWQYVPEDTAEGSSCWMGLFGNLGHAPI